MDTPQLVDAARLAALTDISVHTWRHWRKARKGPPCYRINGRVLYDVDEVNEWIRSKREAA